MSHDEDIFAYIGLLSDRPGDTDKFHCQVSVCALKFREAMRNFVRTTLAMLSIFLLSACSRNNPGPLAGSWRMGGIVPVTVHFRPGETETMGVIEKVSYEVNGNVVIVRYESGVMKGSAVRFVLTGPDTARSDIMVLQRIR